MGGRPGSTVGKGQKFVGDTTVRRSWQLAYCFLTYMKNCEPFVLGPLFAIDSKNGLSCLSLRFSSEYAIMIK